MSLIKLPEIQALSISNANFDTRTDVMDKWQPEIQVRSDKADNTITIYDQIGEDFWGDGVTAKRIAAALRSIGDNDVVVNINSPGGDFFEGVAIYNLLKDHPAKVTIQVIGIAASAASIIAMAGDDILMGDSAFLMIHNAWVVAMGNRHDMRASADQLEPFDDAMANLYSKRSGLDKTEIVSMLDKESYINSSDAVEKGFATGLLDEVSKPSTQANDHKKYLATVETALAKQGHTRSQRRDILNNLFHGKPSATDGSHTNSTPSASQNDIANNLQTLINTMQP